MANNKRYFIKIKNTELYFFKYSSLIEKKPIDRSCFCKKSTMYDTNFKRAEYLLQCIEDRLVDDLDLAIETFSVKELNLMRNGQKETV